MLVETDMLIAAMDPEDPGHSIARKILAEHRIALSPYALIEMDLLIKSGVIVVKDYIMFWRKLNSALEQYKIRIVKPRPLHFAKAHKLRTQHGLTYFDSLHAAVALVEDLELVSFDEKAYSTIVGLKYRHPRDLA
ncbi:MAG: hypothetical protein DRN15_06415 [Thermoprotei archaeon]|nr:MAG: hypothetical protein DRN15_06415 [Thermoprotei archaeon]